MHIDCAIELVQTYEADSFVKGDSLAVVRAVVTEPELLALIDRRGDEKHRSIAATVRQIKSSGNSRRRVTSAQEIALARHLLEIFGGHRAILAAAYGKTEEEMFGKTPAQVDTPTKAESDNGKKRAAAAAKAAAEAEFMGLPKLRGTEKQIAWAEQIRHDYIAWAGENNIDPMTAIDGKHANKAAFWIDNRREFRRISQNE